MHECASSLLCAAVPPSQIGPFCTAPQVGRASLVAAPIGGSTCGRTRVADHVLRPV